MVVECSLMVDVVVHEGMLTEGGSSWGQNVISPNNRHMQHFLSMNGSETTFLCYGLLEALN
jgi:hypothetical protein